MRLFCYILLLVFAHVAYSADIVEFKAQPNDWFSKYNFQAVEIDGARNVSEVLVFFTPRVGDSNSLSSRSWQEFAEENDIGLVSIDYEFMGKRKGKKEGEWQPPLVKVDPEKAHRLLDTQLWKLIRKHYPRAKKVGALGGDAAINYSYRHARKVSFWASESSHYRLRKEPKKQPIGVLFNRSDRHLKRAIENHWKNRIDERQVALISCDGDSHYTTDKYIREYAIEVFRNFGGKGVEYDLLSGEKVSHFKNKEDRKDSNWFPTSRLAEQANDFHSIREEQNLNEVLVKKVPTEIPEQPELRLYLKLPNGSSRKNPPKGVVGIITWMASEESMINIIRHNSFNGELVKWAEENNYALITWNTATLWQTLVGQSEQERETARFMDRRFDKMVKAWEKGISFLAQKYKLPKNGYYLFGSSRGAHWGHRLVLRKPEWFGAVHFHVANSFDIPDTKAQNVLWLLTTGDRAPGHAASLKFYQECQKLDYPIMLKAAENLGHANRGDVFKLGVEYFKYAKAQRDAILSGSTPRTKVEEAVANLMKRDLEKSKYVGDFINQGVYARESAGWIPQSQQVALVNEEFARLWGTIEE